MTAQTDTVALPWGDWLRRWDAQQEVYIEDRERIFDVMFSFLEALVPGDPTVLDLLAGPGAISQRLLQRSPGARGVAVDTDPALLRLGEEALGDQDGRLRWVRADVRDPEWTAALGQEGFDAVLSTTAAHWLEPHELAHLYREVAGLLRPGGVLLNGDGIYFADQQARIRVAAETIDKARQARAVERGSEDWACWWDALRVEPSLQDAFSERDRIFPDRAYSDHAKLAFHEAALFEAGFAEVGAVWQDLHKRVLLAIR